MSILAIHYFPMCFDSATSNAVLTSFAGDIAGLLSLSVPEVPPSIFFPFPMFLQVRHPHLQMLATDAVDSTDVQLLQFLWHLSPSQVAK